MSVNGEALRSRNRLRRKNPRPLGQNASRRRDANGNTFKTSYSRVMIRICDLLWLAKSRVLVIRQRGFLVRAICRAKLLAYVLRSDSTCIAFVVAALVRIRHKRSTSHGGLAPFPKVRIGTPQIV